MIVLKIVCVQRKTPRTKVGTEGVSLNIGIEDTLDDPFIVAVIEEMLAYMEDQSSQV